MGLPDDRGVLVTGVRVGSPAAEKLEQGDVIASPFVKIFLRLFI